MVQKTPTKGAGYKTVQLPKESAVMMDKIIEAQPEFAYRSHAELVMDLIRRKYGEITKPCSLPTFYKTKSVREIIILFAEIIHKNLSLKRIYQFKELMRKLLFIFSSKLEYLLLSLPISIPNIWTLLYFLYNFPINSELNVLGAPIDNAKSFLLKNYFLLL